ncbi:hypothetical protein HF888_03595 [Bermanella marisrubri]|uniref:Carboxypeptidase regulatory-like domain-containing protein n=1 Tax=Bermanella marisrubri TaxID=207949 RepID=Q1MYV9_9GAMM|nr:carboxypeptidase-like regulatory domain-containing protein [Bermanella marisrubri]EAT11182.1 hypothetical protein RED65_07854 [Oceanobacter sp. RED65] [Bermanella marisrubri]QIZ83369.1 hypothetical protein HF888_03595 [Bermanella marisrubri]
MKQLLLLTLFSVLISGCGSSEDKTPEPILDPPIPDYQPSPNNISSISLLDATGQPLEQAMVEISEYSESASEVSGKSLARNINQTSYTDANGKLQVNELEPGRYILSISIAGATVESILEIRQENTASNAAVTAPVSITKDSEGTITNAVSLLGEGIFASFSGIIYGPDGVLADAQIEVSGGEETNGAISISKTNSDGEFTLVINVSINKLNALKNARIRVVKEGYTTKWVDHDISEFANASIASSISGMNYKLDLSDKTDLVVYSEDFEQQGSDAECGFWNVIEFQPLDYEFDDLPPIDGIETQETYQAMAIESEITPIPEELTNLWHLHEQGLDIQNQAWIDNLVQLAPDDTSNGVVPNPKDNYACWYGQGSGNNLGAGNFLGDFGSGNGGAELDGGESDMPNAGALISPVIDLGTETSPLALSFDTWWEIESVNPNDQGFDLMIVSVSSDNGNTWQNIARLNPLTDPITSDGVNRAPIPYSNRGYNKAPTWTSQEPISLSEFAGEQIKIRLAFSTQDGLYNGFRGWLVDNIRITKEEGTFPRYNGSVDFNDLVSDSTASINIETLDVFFSGNVTSNDPVEVGIQSVDSNGNTNLLVSEIVSQGGSFELSADIFPDSTDDLELHAIVMINGKIIATEFIATVPQSEIPQ